MKIQHFYSKFFKKKIIKDLIMISNLLKVQNCKIKVNSNTFKKIIKERILSTRYNNFMMPNMMRKKGGRIINNININNYYNNTNFFEYYNCNSYNYNSYYNCTIYDKDINLNSNYINADKHYVNSLNTTENNNKLYEKKKIIINKNHSKDNFKKKLLIKKNNYEDKIKKLE